MLQQAVDPATLKQTLKTKDQWHPYPNSAERDAWEGLPGTARKHLIEQAEAALGTEWPLLPATLFLEYARIGNRSNFQAPNAQRRQKLMSLVLGECVEGKERFLDEIANGIWLICEESSWCLPAHIAHQGAGVGLPDVTEPVLDLFAGETGGLLAWTCYLLGEKLDTVSPLIRPRIELEIDERVLGPFAEREDFWWMGFRDTSHHVNNWNPWINSNVLACCLIMEDDPDQRLAIVEKVMRSVDRFVDPYPRDGGCDEGPGYWSRAGASLFDCLDLLHQATDGAVDLYANPVIRNIGRFIYRVHIADKWFVNFADAAARLMPDGALVYRYGKCIGDEVMQQFGAWAAQNRGSGKGSLLRALPTLSLYEELQQTTATAPLVRDTWLPDIQVMVARDQAGSSKGLTLAAKGGHNNESHNHNDIGHFIVYTNGKPLLIDVGVEEYRRQTFSAERYDIWTMQSRYHNLPTVDDQQQQPGREFAAADVSCEVADDATTLCLDIAGAHGEDAGIKSWRRTIRLNRGRDVTVREDFELAAAPGEVYLSFMTACGVTIGDGLIELTQRELPRNEVSGSGRISFDSGVLRAEVEEIACTDARLTAIWGESVSRLRLFLKEPIVSGSIETRIEG